MGSAASILSSRNDANDISQLPLVISTGVDLSSSYGHIDATLVALCERSWIRMMSNSSPSVSGGSVAPSRHLIPSPGLFSFCHTFFARMELSNPEHDVLVLMDPRAGSSYQSRESLLVRIVKYILTVPSTSFKVKSKLRSLGRAHARRGILERHFMLFNQVLLQTIAERLPPRHATYEVMKAWNDLLAFVTHQMTFDKIEFRSHCSLAAVSAMSGETSNVEHELPSSSTTTAGMIGNALMGSSLVDSRRSSANADLLLLSAHTIDTDLSGEIVLADANDATIGIVVGKFVPSRFSPVLEPVVGNSGSGSGSASGSGSGSGSGLGSGSVSGSNSASQSAPGAAAVGVESAGGASGSASGSGSGSGSGSISGSRSVFKYESADHPPLPAASVPVDEEV